ncbi:hypothetical protein PIB30_058280 [Stylosanthes scabra]|uniref:WAT1-related protein n=1 Tax=Stylosanthes scabra TaxID=79078 RepID=A0ABU6VN18_9FABA|nr:hypothetical protein [Stylosanthes scabra]
MATRIIRRWSFYRDTLPVMVLIGIECSDTGLYTLFKAATNTGMSDHVFVAYAYALATTLLFPSLFFSKGSRVVPPLSFSVLIKIILLGIIGSSSQVLGYAGIRYSSPTLSSSIGNLVPAFTFLLAIIFRMEKVAAKSRSSQAKVIGSIISIAGAFVVTFYKGPSINIAQRHLSLQTEQHVITILNSVDTTWLIAATLLIADYLLASLWYILQVEILKVYPDELSMVFFYNVTATIVSVTIALFTERNASDWKIGLDISLVSIVCSIRYH